MKRKRLSYDCVFAFCFLFLCAFCTNVFSQNTKERITITGTVRDNLNALLNGASITNLNSHQTIETDASGKFSIIASKGDSMKASYTGYQDFIWVFTDRLDYDISLTAQSGTLNEVVVTGFGGRQKQIGVVGSVATVNATDLQHPVANLSTMLAGRIAGVMGVQRSGIPGSNSADIWIRGIQSFGNNPSGPLIIVDGVRGRTLDNYDPEDIQSLLS